MNYWTGALNNGSFSRVQVVQGIRNSPEHFTQEVDAFYETLLSRKADPTGQAYWVGQFENGLPEEKMAFSFLNSPEYLSKGDKSLSIPCTCRYSAVPSTRPANLSGSVSWATTPQAIRPGRRHR